MMMTSNANDRYRLKLKRPQTAKKYREVIDKMYVESMEGKPQGMIKSKL